MSGGEVGLLTGDLRHYWVTPRLGRCPPTGQAGTVGLSGEAGPGPPRRVPKPAATRNRVLDQPHLLQERLPPAQDRWAPGR